jgi:hypothetical protein
VVLIDLDPQASAAGWGDSREDDTPAIVACPPARLAAALETAKASGVRYAFIDTAPHAESPALTAARAADLIVIPTRPGILDLRAIGATIEIATLAKKRAVLVLNAAPPALASYGIEASPRRSAPACRVRSCPGRRQDGRRSRARRPCCRRDFGALGRSTSTARSVDTWRNRL